MPLPAPNLDDRRFQDLVDEAKRYVQQHCPSWSDHNVSDPGVTLIETFAWMTDQLLYRLNRVPERLHLAFLDLLGIQLLPPASARVPLTFWLSAPQPELLRIPAGTTASTVRQGDDRPVTFMTLAEHEIPTCRLEHLLNQVAGDTTPSRLTTQLEGGKPVACFSAVPEVGDVLMIGLSEPVPSCAVLLRADCTIEGVGVDPESPPLAWEAFDGTTWQPCEVERDTTGGLNRSGEIVLHVPASHAAAVLQRSRAGWLRCRVTEPVEDQPRYSASPVLHTLSAATIGGTTDATHAEHVTDEILGLSEGIPGQRFELRHRPVVTSLLAPVVQVSVGEGWEDWQVVDTFAGSGPDDHHVVLSPVSGEVWFGPAVREPIGGVRHHGAVPPKGTPIRVSGYYTGGGQVGNVAPRSITVLRSPIPFVSRVENRGRAVGGVDQESVNNAKVRAAFELRSRDRAVTLADYEHLAHLAAPELARVATMAATDDPGLVRVLVVPDAARPAGRIPFDALVPDEEAVRRVAQFLDERRMVGARVVVEPPLYQGVTVVARIRAAYTADPTAVGEAALDALYRYFSPIDGGPTGDGWPLGRAVPAGEVHAVLHGVPGVAVVEDARVFAADAITGDRGEAVPRVDLEPGALVFSYEHQVLVEAQS